MRLRVLIARFHRIGFAIAIALATSSGATCLAQTGGYSERDIPASGPPSSIVRSPYGSGSAAGARPAPPAESAAAPASGYAGAEAIPKPPPKPRTTIPYTIRPGDSMGSIAGMFGLTPEELGKMNRLHPDAELMAGDELKVPNPFIAQVTSLQSQVNSLSAEARSAQQKADSNERELTSLRDKVQDLSADNQSLNASLRTLPWWHATALTTSVVAMLMFGVMVVTLFEWWRMRRRYVEPGESGR